MRTRDMGMARRHSSRIMNLLGYVFFWNIALHLDGE